MLDHFYKNIQCKKIFLAGCHHNDYVKELRGYTSDPDAGKRIVFVETMPAESAFQELQLPVARFDTVFHCEHLCPKIEPITTMSSTSTHEHAPRIPMSRTPENVVTTFKPFPSYDTSRDGFSGKGIPLKASINSNGNGDTRRLPRPSHSFYSSKYQHGRRQGIIKRNKRGFRLDPARESIEYAVWKSFDRKRIGANDVKNNFCNDYYLTGRCGQHSCKRIHGVQLKPLELKILEYKARDLPCPKSRSCDDPACYKSHHCPFGLRCRKRDSTCKFPLHFALDHTESP